MLGHPRCAFFFFFNDTATTEIYTLSLHDALPICGAAGGHQKLLCGSAFFILMSKKSLGNEKAGSLAKIVALFSWPAKRRSEEHTSELQSHLNLVCRLLLEKKKINKTIAR